MAERIDPKLIADALRFLAAGFDLAGRAGVPAVIRTLKLKDGDEGEACGREKAVRAVCADETLDMQGFSTPLPHQFLLQAIGSGESRLFLEQNEARGGASFGGPPQDGSETYELRRAELIYTETPGDRFRLVVNMHLGEPVRNTFVYRAPVDQSDLVHQARLEVEFASIFNFLAPITKFHAVAIRARLAEQFDLQIDLPSFYVSERNG